MQSGYFAAAWGDIKNSPGWFGKLCLLALISLIPIFGPIAVIGYMYGWARDISWNVHAPMPEKMFGNEDGRQYSRGFFVIVIGVIFMLVPSIVQGIFGGIGTGFSSGNSSTFFLAGFAGFLAEVVVALLYVFALLFSWAGAMRTSIYGRLSAGLQVKKIWAMIRHDSNGLLRILGMTLLVGLIIIFVMMLVMFLLVMVAIFAGIGAMAPFINMGSTVYNDSLIDSMVSSIMPFIVIVIIVGGALSFLCIVASMFLELLQARALGYWARGFEVAQWRGQDDPMPFELQQQYAQPQQGQAQYGQSQPQQQQNAQPYYGTPVQGQPTQQQTAQAQSTQPYYGTPVQQAAPAAEQPTQPTQPTAPAAEQPTVAEPVAAAPAAPTPAQPAAPAAPTPAQPAPAPSAPAEKPAAQPAPAPSAPAAPAQPATPAAPTAPAVKPAVPAEPVNPVAPATPTQPEPPAPLQPSSDDAEKPKADK